MRLVPAIISVSIVFFAGSVLRGQESGRAEHSLDGTWELRAANSETWQPVEVPGTFESQIGVDFDGVAEYRLRIEPIQLKPGRRLLLQFDAVATHSEVWFNDVRMGEHLGAWTPFRFDITEAAESRQDLSWEIRIRVDERVGHNTQGFLPVIAPHFGGIWQAVRLLEVPEGWIDDIGIRVFAVESAEIPEIPSGDSGQIRSVRIGSAGDLVVNLRFFSWTGPERVAVDIREVGEATWHPMELRELITRLHGTIATSHWTLKQNDAGYAIRRWCPEDPVRYELRITEGHEEGEYLIVPVGFRDIETQNDRFLLNGKPLNIRGLLNWGYSPPGTAPTLDETAMRREIEFAKARGFNLMKFCLWIPPTRYLELCDELGMLAWIEYPAWHPDFSKDRLPELKREYNEFFAHVRNHPSVILHSLTCETGSSAELEVIQALYDQCKQEIPGAIVVDDSSWIEWNRVFDFYDDHPYGNNHTWVAELTKLKQFIAEHETKPLVLGEAIAADTWTAPAWFDGEEDAWFHPDFLESGRRWLESANTLYGEGSVDCLLDDSKTCAMLMRKFQMETFRREFSGGGYVVSVIRDMRKAAMGLVDYRNRPKWSADEWSWHGDVMLSLETPADRRAFRGGSSTRFDLHITGVPNDSRNDRSATCSIFAEDGTPISKTLELVDVRGVHCGWTVHVNLPQVERPTRFIVEAEYFDENRHRIASNQWSLWIVPTVRQHSESLLIHASAESDVPMLAQLGLRTRMVTDASEFNAETPPVLSRILDEELLGMLARGGTVVLLPNDRSGSFPLQDHWFLRGGPVLTDRWQAFAKDGWLGPRNMMVELQHFDLAGKVIANIGYLDAIDPIVMLWESHDLSEIKTNGLVFRMPVGEQGQLLVSALSHLESDNPAGHYLLGQLLSPPPFSNSKAKSGRGIQNLERLRRELAARSISLQDHEWKFMPDPDEQGGAAGWFAPDWDDSDWKSIRTDRHWEAQGFEALDGWAWYRLQVTLPADWPAENTWLNFSGVDDYYDVFVNGRAVGSGGNIERRETAFELRSSHDMGHLVEAGRPVNITVAVYDWYGAGGIFRPVTISNRPVDVRPMLK